MLKTILITIVALLIASGAFLIYGTYKVAEVTIDENLKRIEPQLHEYMALNEAAQNEYILKNANEIIATSVAEAKPKDKAEMELLEKTKDDPAVQQAIIKLGRSIMAKGILRLETLANELNTADKTKYQIESDSLKDNFLAYCKVAEEASNKLTTVQ